MEQALCSSGNAESGVPVNKIGDIVTDINERIRSQLFDLQDLKYRDFNASLIPTVDKKTVIGVRTPQLRKLAKELSKDPDIEFFLRTLPHKYYEEYNLHGLIIESMKDYDKCIAEMNKFLPYIDNWATCDIISPKIFKKHLPELLDEIKVWMGADGVVARMEISSPSNFELGWRFSGRLSRRRQKACSGFAT